MVAAWGTNEVGASVAAPGFFAAGTASDTHVGWTVGAGVEWALLDNWSAKVEYLYLDLGNSTYLGGPAAGGFEVDLTAHTVKVSAELSLWLRQRPGHREVLIGHIVPILKAPALGRGFFIWAAVISLPVWRPDRRALRWWLRPVENLPRVQAVSAVLSATPKGRSFSQFHEPSSRLRKSEKAGTGQQSDRVARPRQRASSN